MKYLTLLAWKLIYFIENDTYRLTINKIIGKLVSKLQKKEKYDYMKKFFKKREPILYFGYLIY